MLSVRERFYEIYMSVCYQGFVKMTQTWTRNKVLLSMRVREVSSRITFHFVRKVSFPRLPLLLLLLFDLCHLPFYLPFAFQFQLSNFLVESTVTPRRNRFVTYIIISAMSSGIARGRLSEVSYQWFVQFSSKMDQIPFI